MDCLIVVDMQNDFVTGTLGSEDARKIVPAVVERVRRGAESGEKLIFTRDTHGRDYLETQEGKNLPVSHCISGTDGWAIIPELQAFAAESITVDKPTFGSRRLGELLAELDDREKLGKITLIGLCTDICVISNAMVAKAFLPETPLCVEAACCAGVTPESHETALKAMAACQIAILPSHNTLI